MCSYIDITLDPTFDPPLNRVFPIPKWNGHSNTATIVPLENVKPYTPTAPLVKVVYAYGRIVRRSQDTNHAFYVALDEWLDNQRI